MYLLLEIWKDSMSNDALFLFQENFHLFSKIIPSPWFIYSLDTDIWLYLGKSK